MKCDINTSIDRFVGETMKLALLFEIYLKDVLATTTKENHHHNSMNSKVMMYFFKNSKIINTEDLSREVIYDLITYLRYTRDNCINSCNKKIGTLKRALAFSNIYITGVSNFKKMRYQEIHFDVVSTVNLSRILTYLESLSYSSVNLTRYLVFKMLLYTGCRANELVNIKISNIDLDLNMIKLNKTKSKRPRFVVYDESIQDRLIEYINLSDREYLFYNFRSNKAYTRRHLRSYFDYMKKKFKMKKLHPHMLRHTMGTLLYDNGATDIAIADYLGHEDIKTTQIYVHLSKKSTKSTFNNFFPKI